MNGTSAMLAAGLGVVAAFGIDFTTEAIHPSSQGLYIDNLSFDGSVFTQVIGSISGEAWAGQWSAEIYRNSSGMTDQLCAGRGIGNYNGHVQRYDPDEWTDDRCPDLLPNDRASVTWAYVNENGLKQSVGVDLSLEELGFFSGL